MVMNGDSQIASCEVLMFLQPFEVRLKHVIINVLVKRSFFFHIPRLLDTLGKNKNIDKCVYK